MLAHGQNATMPLASSMTSPKVDHDHHGLSSPGSKRMGGTHNSAFGAGSASKGGPKQFAKVPPKQKAAKRPKDDEKK